MAKPLDERIAAAMAERARAATVAELIEEVAGAIAEARSEHERLDALSNSASASEDDAEAAADAVAKLARRIVRLSAKKEQLEQRHAEILAVDSRRKARAEYEAKRERRDQLAADLAEEWPRLTQEIVDLLSRIQASDAEIAGTDLISAEAIARQCPPNFYAVGPVFRFTAIKLPSLLGRNREEMAWPDPRPEMERVARLAEAEHRVRIAAKERQAEEAARWARYAVTPPPSGEAIRISSKHGAKSIRVATIEAVMSREHVEEARAAGCTVTPLKDNESIGLPSSNAVFA